MRNVARSGDGDALERLRGDEAALERELAAARADASAAIEGARREAERVAAAARRDLERLREGLRAEELAAVEQEAERARELLALEVAQLARRAERNSPRALERVLAVVLGRPP